MKVVLFCGGYGMRMRGGGADVPKPLQLVGPYPLLVHVMRYYAHFGHTEFVLCLGYGAKQIKEVFLRHSEALSNDFRLHKGEVELLSTDISDWDITFVDTGMDTGIGDRLRKVEEFIGDDEMFLANYADVLCDVDLDHLVERFTARPEMVVSLLAVPPQSSFHVLDLDGHDVHAPAADHDDAAHAVTHVRPVSEIPLWENGGYLLLRREVFDWLEEGKDLVGHTCVNLAAEGRLLAQQHRGFWKPADTFKERAELDAMWSRGDRPWVLSEKPACTP